MPTILRSSLFFLLTLASNHRPRIDRNHERNRNTKEGGRTLRTDMERGTSGIDQLRHVLKPKTLMKPKYPEGFLEQNLENCRNATMCEGGCEEHSGGIQPVRVIDPSGTPHDWGYYSYCETAIEEDKNRGFKVIMDGEDSFLPNTEVSHGVEPKA